MLGGLLAIFVAGYVLYLARSMAPFAIGSDQSGYLNSARLMSQGKLFALPRLLPGTTINQFASYWVVPLGFVPRADGRLAPTYPTGYPLQLAAASVFGWDQAPTVVNLLSALASGLLLFAYSRKLGLSHEMAIGGVCLLWFCPLFIISAILPMSDLSALCWTMAALYCAISAREHQAWGLLCGAAVGMAVLVRPTNALLLAPLLVALGFRFRSWLAVGLGALPAATFFCYYNWQVYGAPFTTGYGDISSSLDRKYLGYNLAHFSHWIPILLSPLSVLALIAPYLPAVRQRGYAVLFVWFVVLTGFYLLYYFSGQAWWYLRFILPAFPAIIIGMLAVVDAAATAARLRSVTAAVAFGALVTAGLVWQMHQTKLLGLRFTRKIESSFPDSALWARQNIPADSVIFCMQVSGAFFYYTDFLLVRWDVMEPEQYHPLLEVTTRLERTVYAALYPFETPEALKRIGGNWTKLHTEGQVTFWRRQP